VFREKYDFHTHFFPQAYRVAQSIIKSWKAGGGGSGDGDKSRPVMRKKIVRVPRTVFKIDVERGVLLLTIRPNERVEIPLELSDYHRKLLARGDVREVLLGGGVRLHSDKSSCGLVGAERLCCGGCERGQCDLCCF